MCVDSRDIKTKLTFFLTQVILVLLPMVKGSAVLFGSPHLSHSKCWIWNTVRCSNNCPSQKSLFGTLCEGLIVAPRHSIQPSFPLYFIWATSRVSCAQTVMWYRVWNGTVLTSYSVCFFSFSQQFPVHYIQIITDAFFPLNICVRSHFSIITFRNSITN